LGCFLEVYLAGTQGVRHVGRELKQRQILPDEAAQGNSARCFTLKEAAELAGRFHQLFA
jgi:hypothetical protein